MNKLSVLDWVAVVLVIIGGLNWGLVAINMNWNVVETLLGTETVARVVYGLVGLSALYLLVTVGKLARR